jgi:hypothetical protein
MKESDRSLRIVELFGNEAASWMTFSTCYLKLASARIFSTDPNAYKIVAVIDNAASQECLVKALENRQIGQEATALAAEI